MIGDGARNLLRKVLAATGEATEALVERPIRAILIIMPPISATAPRPIRTSTEAMDELAAQGVRLAICTNKSDAADPAAAGRARLDRIDSRAMVGGDSLPWRQTRPRACCWRRSRGPAAAAPLLVGNSIFDAETARAARLPFVAVSFGFRDRPVEALGADAVIDSYAELIPALARLAG